MAGLPSCLLSSPLLICAADELVERLAGNDGSAEDDLGPSGQVHGVEALVSKLVCQVELALVELLQVQERPDHGEEVENRHNAVRVQVARLVAARWEEALGRNRRLHSALVHGRQVEVSADKRRGHFVLDGLGDVDVEFSVQGLEGLDGDLALVELADE